MSSKPPPKDDERELIEVVMLEEHIELIEMIRRAIDLIEVNDSCKYCKQNATALEQLALFIEATEESRH